MAAAIGIAPAPAGGDNSVVLRPRQLSAARRLGLLVAAAGAVGLAALLGRPGATRSSGSTPACAAATVTTIAAVDNATADDIYANELAGTEVSFDSAEVTGSTALSAAVAAEDASAAHAAVSRLVFHPAWHIVRLRALDAAGRILADVGGPYVIAPVPGVLRSRGRVVGSYLMSVQDDTGYTKLETRYVGNPIGIYYEGKLVAERYASFGAVPPRGGEAALGGVSYRVLRDTYKAFPSATLTAVILVAPPPPALGRQSCAQVRAGEFGRIAERFARLAVSLPQHYAGFARTVTLYTRADVFVRDGTTQLASTGGAGPATIPSAGTVSYAGRSWLVFSFEPRPGTRVYVLAPPA
jgi:hypothetical protein